MTPCSSKLRWANVTLGQSCEVENTPYIAYGVDGEFIDIVSRYDYLFLYFSCLSLILPLPSTVAIAVRVCTAIRNKKSVSRRSYLVTPVQLIKSRWCFSVYLGLCLYIYLLDAARGIASPLVFAASVKLLLITLGHGFMLWSVWESSVVCVVLNRYFALSDSGNRTVRNFVHSFLDSSETT